MNIDIEPTSSIEKSKYLNRMDEALRTICSLISPNLFFHIYSCKTPNEAWKILEGLFGKQDYMRGHMLEVNLLTLDPTSFDNIQDFFTKFKDLLSQLKACEVDKSEEEKKMVLTILSKLGIEFLVFLSTFHTIKDKYKHKSHAHMKKEGYTKPFTDASRSKGEKGRKGEKCTYCHKGFHSEYACMKKTNRYDVLDTSAKQPWRSHPRGCKEEEARDLNSKKGNSSHALIAINSSPDAWIIDSGASHHMDSSEVVYSLLDSCKGPPILMGDNSSIEVTGKGRIELTNESFENMLHVPKIFVNLLSMYQMKNFGTRKKVIFTPNSMDIYDMQTNSMVSTGEVNHQSRLYTFSEFIEHDYSLLLTHADESSRTWHKRFGHLNFRYMQHLSKHRLVDGLTDIHFSKGVCEGCVLGKHPQEKFDKGKS
jgi:hypothetical protein